MYFVLVCLISLRFSLRIWSSWRDVIISVRLWSHGWICVLTCAQVRFGQQKRYQDWFQRQYLSTAESQSLRCDLIRYICGVVHPSNEVLSSDILPRWAIIGWLLTTCTVRGRDPRLPGGKWCFLNKLTCELFLQSNVAASNAKLALFYDWLFFNPEKDSIMNIGNNETPSSYYGKQYNHKYANSSGSSHINN